jgi:hypothetical protein
MCFQASTGQRLWLVCVPDAAAFGPGYGRVLVAIDDLPLPAVNFPNVIGVPWPYIDEDVLVEFASLTRRFAPSVERTHDDASRAVAGIAQMHQSASTEAMSSRLARMSDQHVWELVDGCQGVGGRDGRGGRLGHEAST